MKQFSFLWAMVFFLLNCISPSRAAVVDSVQVYSAAMKRDISCTVIRPDSYRKKRKERFPVVYLLHGYSGWYSNWLIRVPQLKDWADAHQLMIVCPDGGYSSWYFDSPVDSTMRYETHVSQEVVAYIDAQYRTLASPAGRAITGLSMGGHGGLFLGLRHPDVYGACGSMSGGVDINASRLKYDIAKRIGDTVQYAQNWKDYSVHYMLEKYRHTKQAIIFDCGTADFYYEINRRLHERMLELKIPHDYTERPGKHDWPYWINAVQHQLLYFSNYFKSSISASLK